MNILHQAARRLERLEALDKVAKPLARAVGRAVRPRVVRNLLSGTDLGHSPAPDADRPADRSVGDVGPAGRRRPGRRGGRRSVGNCRRGGRRADRGCRAARLVRHRRAGDPGRAAQVRFYVDADILGLGKILGDLRNDVTYPGDPGAVARKRHRAPCPIASPDVLDTDWIPDVAARGWLIVTRDSMIIQNRNEITAIRENNAKMAALNQRDAQTKWGQLEVFMTQCRHIEALTAERGPFIWRVSRTAMTPIPLD
jgi:hypothetical protein